MTLAELRHEYRPYDTLAAFDEGFADYQAHNYYSNPYDVASDGELDLRAGVNAQAWDRGAECASRWQRYCEHGSSAERPRDFMWPTT